jgi:hypothetical protein
VLPPYAVAHALGVLLAAQALGLGGPARVRVTPPTPLLAGAVGELSLTILDTPARVVPLSVRLSSATVTLPETRLGEADVVDPLASQPRVRARYVAPAVAGTHEVEGLVEYVTCTGEAASTALSRPSPGGAEGPRCRPRRARVVWVVQVLAAGPSGAGERAPEAAR